MRLLHNGLELKRNHLVGYCLHVLFGLKAEFKFETFTSHYSIKKLNKFNKEIYLAFKTGMN